MEKLDRWGKRMHVIDISQWPTHYFVNTAKLSAKLLPYVNGFQVFMENILTLNVGHEEYRRQIIEKQNILERKTEKE